MKIFISYRREDSAGHAGRLFDRLSDKLGRDKVFRDVDKIRPGENFMEAIQNKIDVSDVLLVLIGPRWLAAADQEGRPRLQAPEDVVRLEIEMGLKRKIHVIPVLLPGAIMPSSKDLPETLSSLAAHNAFEIHEVSFDRDVLHLISLAKAPKHFKLSGLLKRPIVLFGSIAFIIAAIIAFVFWLRPAFLMTPARARLQLALMGRSYDSSSFVKAAKAGDAVAVSLFLRAGMQPDETPGDDTALALAMEDSHFDIARLLIQSGANV